MNQHDLLQNGVPRGFADHLPLERVDVGLDVVAELLSLVGTHGDEARPAGARLLARARHHSGGGVQSGDTSLHGRQQRTLSRRHRRKELT